MMWKDRLSGYSTPATHSQPPSRPRSQSPSPATARKASHLAPLAGITQRPGFSPRSSSLSLISNVSASSRAGRDVVPGNNHLEGGGDASSAEQVDVTRILETLESILSSIPRRSTQRTSHDRGVLDGGDTQPKRSSLVLNQAAGIGFERKSLQEFVQVDEKDRRKQDDDGRSSHDCM